MNNTSLGLEKRGRTCSRGPQVRDELRPLPCAEPQNVGSRLCQVELSVVLKLLFCSVSGGRALSLLALVLIVNGCK